MSVVNEIARARVFRQVAEELDRQFELWGEQNHPDGTGDESGREAAKMARNACNEATAQGVLTWWHILHEEVFEVCAESAVETLETELIQVAAVAVQWILAIRRRR